MMATVKPAMETLSATARPDGPHPAMMRSNFEVDGLSMEGREISGKMFVAWRFVVGAAGAAARVAVEVLIVNMELVLESFVDDLLAKNGELSKCCFEW